ncbi:Crp/Fnr family transcriptional regulator [Shumkonia mesophila]|uniref:Crp/Fnr family transcriptional regulator n=1 Tax=Shumkonia mesophila TaxID=2838854 RepID=UPI0029352F03|nr:Crp/Fnr family transcriptional regulator [Shumkonia mesophila]
MAGDTQTLLAEPGPKLLKGVDLLADLLPHELVEIEELCRFKTFRAGTQVFDRQADTRDVFFVVRGRVRIVNYSMSGREITLDDIGAGGHFGELAAIDSQPRSAAVLAVEDSLIVALPQRHFVEALEKYPSIALRVMKRLARMVRASTERIMDLSTLAANNRVQAELLRQARDTVKDDNTAVIAPIPVHSDIASRVSTTRETVARVLSDLTRQGILERTRDSLIIRDVERLEEMVEEVRGL